MSKKIGVNVFLSELKNMHLKYVIRDQLLNNLRKSNYLQNFTQCKVYIHIDIYIIFYELALIILLQNLH